MALRIVKAQLEHDQVVEAVAQHYRRLGLVVHTNPGPSHNFSFGSVYPDVRVDLLTGRCYLFEVETADSVTHVEARQWREYGQSFPFNLIVPEDSFEQARSLVAQHGIQNVWLYSYKPNSTGSCSFSGLPIT